MATISLSDDVYERIAARVDDTEFESVERYVEYVLTEVLNRLEASHETTAGDRNEVLDKLRDLGYLE